MDINGENIWYHGTPDVRGLEKDGGFTQKYLDIEYADDIDGYEQIQRDLKAARESGNEDEYFRLLDLVGDYRKNIKIKKPIFLSDSQSVANTYADQMRAFDYQGAEEKVLKVKVKPGKTVTINAPGDRFRFIDISKVREGFLSAGVDENELDLMIRKLNFALGVSKGIKTDDVAALGDWFGFDYIDVKGVLDSYNGGSVKSTVRMVFNPGDIEIVKMEEIRKIVRQVIKEELVQERLMNVDDDVDMIYDYFFKDDIEKIQKTKSLNGIDFESKEYNTSFLNSSLSKKSSKLNRCIIFINVASNHYNPTQSVISVSISDNAINFANEGFGGNLIEAYNYLKKREGNRKADNFMNEFSEYKIKGSIHHELAHWIDDTLHNNHIKSRINKANELGIGINKKGLPINVDKMEIQGQIHNIKQLKNKYNDVWDDLTFDELKSLTPIINFVYNQLKGDIRDKWIRDLKTRMHREGLLGKNMENG